MQGLSWLQAIFLALLQGVSELFPISSLGHTVLIPAFLNWGNVQAQETFVPFVVMLHLGTAGALLVFYRDRWAGIVQAFVGSAVRGRFSHTPEEHLAWMLFFGTIPAGMIGAVFESPIKKLFATPLVAAVFLIVNGLVMIWTERLRSKQGATGSTEVPAAASSEPNGDGLGIADLTWRDALLIGSVQAFALIPGISRSGVTMCAGLLKRMRHEDAANYTFMLATPLIAAAGLLEVPTLIQAGQLAFTMALIGGLCAALTAYLSLRFLTRYFQFGRLNPFAYYCIAIGLFGVVYVVTHGVSGAA